MRRPVVLLPLLLIACAANPDPVDGGEADAGPTTDAGAQPRDAGDDAGDVDTDAGGVDTDAGDGTCGDGVLQVGETCDPGLDTCCDASCNGPAAAGTECRAAAGPCDVAETCDGAGAACPVDALAPTTVECRAAADVCDVAESCDGASAGCPTNAFAGASVECRAAADLCDAAEMCTGTGAACPADALAPAMTVCRPSVGGCDPAEQCSGTSAMCPADVVSGVRPNVGLYAADDMAAHVTVQSFLNSTGLLGTVTIGGPVTTAFTPTAAQLNAHDAVFVWGSASWDGTAFGNVLADYVDNGGGVVISVFAQRSSASVGVAGRMLSAGYLAYVPASHGVGNLSLGTVAIPSHPIMNGVMSLSGTALQYHNGSHAAGATLVASLSNGRPLVATLDLATGRSTLLGFYPVRLWDTSTDGARLMANSLVWAAGCAP